MKLIKTSGLLVAAFALVAIGAREAAAQAPTLTVTAVGDSVTILWTAIPGATGYTLAVGTAPGEANLATVNLPAIITRIVVRAPAATYYLRVRAFAGALVGPISNEATITVPTAAPPPAPCSPPPAPTATTSTSGLTVNVSWDNVGAPSYRVVYGRTPGAADLIQEVGAATSSSLPVGFAGTFHVFVQAVNACGMTNSQPVAFTLGTPGPPPGGGPRTPNPPPGTLLPPPTYGQSVVDVISRQYAGDLANACHTRTYLFRLVQALRQRDTRWGLNYKRGNRGSLSTDVVTYNPTDRPDEGESQVYLFDVVGAICEGNYPTFHDVTATTWAARGNPICGSEWCAQWTLEPYIAAGFTP